MTKVENITTEFEVGDKVRSENGHTGIITAIEIDEFNAPHVRADVKWERIGSGRSYRPVDGLTKIA